MDPIRPGSDFSLAPGSLDVRSMPIDTVAFYLAISQTESLDRQIKDRLETIRAKQVKVAEARETIASMKEILARAKNGEVPEIPERLKSRMKENGTPWTESPGTAAKRRELEGLEGKKEALKGDLKEMEELKAALENLKKNGVEHISTGERIILGRHPELMLKLEKYGVIPPDVGGGPYDGFARRQAAQGAPPYDKREYIDMAKRLPVGWEELSVQEMDKVLGDLQVAMTAKQGEINNQQGRIDGAKGELAGLIAIDLETNIDKVNNSIKDLNSAVELDMLNVQSMMSKRGQALQMSSDILKKSNESKDAIIRNI